MKYLAVTFSLMLLAACASTPEPRVDYDQNFDFGRVHSVALKNVVRTDLENTLISDMQQGRIDAALEGELRNKGYTVPAKGSAADLLLTWHLVTQERTDVRSYNSVSYYTCWRCGPSVSDVSVNQYTQGTFIIDMIDPARNKSIWRSVIHSKLSADRTPNSPEALRAAAAHVLGSFPPAP